jgi:hypothetical protein
MNAASVALNEAFSLRLSRARAEVVHQKIPSSRLDSGRPETCDPKFTETLPMML